MKNFIKSNPMAFALIVVFLLLIVVGVITSKAAERAPASGGPAVSASHGAAPAARLG